jgi:hypothetical protein
MKKIVYIFFMCMGLLQYSSAATRGDVQVLEASENIRYLSQKMAKDYLFLFYNPQKTDIKEQLNNTLVELNNDLRMIVTTTKDVDTKDILEFLAYSKDQIEEIIKEKPTEERAALMLDYSETFLEGADSIANAHKYAFSREEEMLMTTKEIEYLLERVSKYYMAFNVGFNTLINNEQMNGAIKELEKNLKKINNYMDYPATLEIEKIEMNKLWAENRIFFEKSGKLFIPNLLFLSISYLVNSVDKISIYHSKNQ